MLDAARERAQRARPARRPLPLAHHQRRGGLAAAMRRARPSTTSTPTSHSRCASTSRSAATQFLHDGGAEMLVETARFWAELGFFSERREGEVLINGVTGPDEYTTVVDNNAFTNLMARENLEIAVRPWSRCARSYPRPHAAGHRDRPERRRARRWRRAAEGMYVPRDDEARSPAGRRVPRPRAVGLRGHAARALPPAPALPSAVHLSAPGDQAGRRDARGFLLGNSSRPRRSAASSTTTTR